MDVIFSSVSLDSILKQFYNVLVRSAKCVEYSTMSYMQSTPPPLFHLSLSSRQPLSHIQTSKSLNLSRALIDKYEVYSEQIHSASMILIHRLLGLHNLIFDLNILFFVFGHFQLFRNIIKESPGFSILILTFTSMQTS